jgi:adenylate cyclase
LLDQVAVRGRSKAIFAYELLSNDNSLLKNLEQYNTEFKKAFTLYQQGVWDKAIIIFESMSKIYPYDKLLKIYIERCNNFKNIPPINWEGIWRIQ